MPRPPACSASGHLQVGRIFYEVCARQWGGTSPQLAHAAHQRGRTGEPLLGQEACVVQAKMVDLAGREPHSPRVFGDEAPGLFRHEQPSAPHPSAWPEHRAASLSLPAVQLQAPAAAARLWAKAAAPAACEPTRRALLVAAPPGCGPAANYVNDYSLYRTRGYCSVACSMACSMAGAPCSVISVLRVMITPPPISTHDLASTPRRTYAYYELLNLVLKYSSTRGYVDACVDGCR